MNGHPELIICVLHVHLMCASARSVIRDYIIYICYTKFAFARSAALFELKTCIVCTNNTCSVMVIARVELLLCDCVAK